MPPVAQCAGLPSLTSSKPGFSTRFFSSVHAVPAPAVHRTMPKSPARAQARCNVVMTLLRKMVESQVRDELCQATNLSRCDLAATPPATSVLPDLPRTASNPGSSGCDANPSTSCLTVQPFRPYTIPFTRCLFLRLEMPFAKVETQVNFAAQENDILTFWDKIRAFEKLCELRRAGPRWSFLDGPITANNP